MKSLRRTALTWVTVLLALAGAASFAVAYEFALFEADSFLDGQLRQIALNAGEGVSATDAPPVDHDPADDFSIQIWAPSGALIRQSPAGLGLPLPSWSGFATIEHAGVAWRIYAARDARRTVEIGQRLEVRQEMATASAIQASVPVLLVIPVIWLLIGWVLSRMTGRLAVLADSIASRSLDQRDLVPEDEAPQEVRPLVSAMNALTNRLQGALDRQKRFISDAAHELRTPLTVLSLQLDNLRVGLTPDQMARASDMERGLRRATMLVRQLLQLARSEEAEATARPQSLDLCVLLSQCVADFVPLAEAGGIDLGLSVPTPIFVSGLPYDLKLLFDNVIDNAIRYTPPGGAVDVSARLIGKAFRAEILDTGRGVPAADLPHLLDRFFRSAPTDVDGTGLGLAIAASVANWHGFEIKIDNRPDRSGLRIRVTGCTSEPRLIRP